MCEQTKQDADKVNIKDAWWAAQRAQAQVDAVPSATGGYIGESRLGLEVGKYAGPGSRQVLQDRARRLRTEAQQCEALAASIPDAFPPEADQALRELLSRGR